jgi:hypothetical protein
MARLLGALLLCACAGVQAIPQIRSYVRVRNDHWLEQVVYATCGSRVRIGVAPSLQETLLRVPRECEDRSVSFSSDPIGSHEVSRSDGMLMTSGDVVRLHIPAFFNGYLYLSR